MQEQETLPKVPRYLARAVVRSIAHLHNAECVADHLFYNALHVAAQLRCCGVAVRIDYDAHNMVLSDIYALPLYTHSGLRSSDAAAAERLSSLTFSNLSVCGEDMAAIAYHYCFGTCVYTLVPDKPGVMSFSSWCAVFRLAALLLPAPQDLLTALPQIKRMLTIRQRP